MQTPNLANELADLADTATHAGAGQAEILAYIFGFDEAPTLNSPRCLLRHGETEQVPKLTIHW